MKAYKIFISGLLLSAVLASVPERAVCNEDSAKSSINIILKYYKISDDSSYVKVITRTRKGKEIIYLSHIIVNLYVNEITREGMQGSISTDENGEGIFTLPTKFYRLKDTSSSFILMASVDNNPDYETTVQELDIVDARLKTELIDEDSLKYVKAILYTIEDGEETPVEEAEVRFYVKRMFSLLPFGGSYTYTDENGEIMVEMPANLPGDENGNLTFVVKVEDHEEFGNLESSVSAEWGVPVQEEKQARTLWASSANAPLWLLISANVIILLTWTIIIYLLVQLFRIRRLGRTT